VQKPHWAAPHSPNADLERVGAVGGGEPLDGGDGAPSASRTGVMQESVG
jgi:hypothetical protein